MPFNLLTKRLSFGNTTVGKLLGFVVDILVIIVIAIAASMLVKTFVAKSFYIPSESMMPTLEVNDNILVSRLQPSIMPLQRGDIIVFKDTQNWMNLPPSHTQETVWESLSSFVMLSEPAGNKFLVKRIVGLPGDEVSCCDANGRITINGKPLKESYLPADVEPSQLDFSVTVPEGKVWVMGDNRSNSSDSRYHQDLNGGFINEEDIIGRAFYRFLPFDRMTGL